MWNNWDKAEWEWFESLGFFLMGYYAVVLLVRPVWGQIGLYSAHELKWVWHPCSTWWLRASNSIEIHFFKDTNPVLVQPYGCTKIKINLLTVVILNLLDNMNICSELKYFFKLDFLQSGRMTMMIDMLHKIILCKYQVNGPENEIVLNWF